MVTNVVRLVLEIAPVVVNILRSPALGAQEPEGHREHSKGHQHARHDGHIIELGNRRNYSTRRLPLGA